MIFIFGNRYSDAIFRYGMVTDAVLLRITLLHSVSGKDGPMRRGAAVFYGLTIFGGKIEHLYFRENNDWHISGGRSIAFERLVGTIIG